MRAASTWRPLLVIEVGRNSDDRLVHFLIEGSLRDRTSDLQDHGLHLGRCVPVIADLDETAAVVIRTDAVAHPTADLRFGTVMPPPARRLTA